jgi:hypothetical protein
MKGNVPFRLWVAQVSSASMANHLPFGVVIDFDSGAAEK